MAVDVTAAIAPARPAPPLRLAAEREPLAVLPAALEAAAGKMEAVQAWNRASRLQPDLRTSPRTWLRFRNWC